MRHPNELLTFYLPKTPAVENTNLVFRIDVQFYGSRVTLSPLRLVYSIQGPRRGGGGRARAPPRFGKKKKKYTVSNKRNL